MKTFFKILIVLLIVLLCFFLLVKSLKIVYPLKYFEIVKEEALKNNIDPYLVMAVIKNESGFKTNVKSNKDAKGLMQLIESTAEDVNKKNNITENVSDNIYDEKVNIALGCKYLASLIEKYDGNYYVAICAYNAGMGNVDKWISQGIIDTNLSEYKNVKLPFEETKNYLKSVICTYKIYRKLYK